MASPAEASARAGPLFPVARHWPERLGGPVGRVIGRLGGNLIGRHIRRGGRRRLQQPELLLEVLHVGVMAGDYSFAGEVGAFGISNYLRYRTVLNL